MKRYLAALLLAMGLVSGAMAAAITYAVDRTIGAGTVTGTIETDGTLGVLAAANIIGFDLTLTSPSLAGGSPDIFSDLDGHVILVGTALSATGSDLIFDFAAGSGSGFALQSLVTSNAWCIVNAGISCIGEPTPSEGIYFAGGGGPAELRHPTAAESVGTAVPAPASLPLIAVALLALGLARRRTHR